MRIVLLLVFAGLFQGDVKVENFEWMSGCWKRDGRNAESFVVESWGKAHDMMLGTGQTIRNGRTTGFEFLRIEKRGEKIFYVARPAKAKSETSFELTSYKENNAVFENPTHDFPKKISYSREGEKMTAIVSAGEQGFTLGFKKVGCAG